MSQNHNPLKKRYLLFFFMVFFFIFSGILVYYFGKSIILFDLLGLKQQNLPLKGSVIVNYYPDFIWSLSLSLIIQKFFNSRKYIIIGFLFCFLLELMQLYQSQFTFDYNDLLVISAGFSLPYFIRLKF